MLSKGALDEDRQSRKAETVGSLQPNQIRRGIVRRLTNYGAFIDLGGIDGLLHISEMSWTRINHPSEVLKEGQELDVVVLKMDLDAGRVSLGLRQILPDPWTGIDARYHPGDIITGQVTRVVPFGIFVQVEGGIEGIIPNAEMGSRKGVTQVELAERLERAQASISAMETADDNLLSTVRSVVESMGGRLELVAVFDDERIAIATRDDPTNSGDVEGQPANHVGGPHRTDRLEGTTRSIAPRGR